jgi:hypothetical protein
LGVTKLAFSVRMEAAYHLLVEWRDDAEPYHSGPMLTLADGAISANGRKLADLPAEAWIRVEMTAGLGEQSDGTWTCSIALPGKELQKFEGLKFAHPSMKRLDWLGFISPGKPQARCWLDDMVIENRPK